MFVVERYCPALASVKPMLTTRKFKRFADGWVAIGSEATEAECERKIERLRKSDPARKNVEYRVVEA